MNRDQGAPVNAAAKQEADGRSLFILALAVVIGIGFGALTAAKRSSGDYLPEAVVARVNGTDIPRLEYQRALRLFASEKRDPLTDHDRMLVLQRIIEEELLVQHGANSGLVRRDRGVRTAIMQAILTGLLVEIEASVKEVTSNNISLQSPNTSTGVDITDSPDLLRDAELRAYLGQLRELATIRWMDGDSGR